MCRFALYLGPPLRMGSLVTEPDNSIINQSFKSWEGEEPLNGDGFGVAWYVPELSAEPAVFKDITPAWNNPNLRDLARVTRSGTILAHVRAATPGMDVARRNCHPFSAGAFAWMHNGHLAGFRAVRRKLLERLSDAAFQNVGGATDSEHLFALFLDRHAELDGGLDPAERLARALAAAIAEAVSLVRAVGLDEPSFLNLAVTDGVYAAVSRYADGDPERTRSLYLHCGHRYVCEGGDLRTAAPEPEGGSVLVASEPLTRDEHWTKVPPNQMVVVAADRTVEIRPLPG